MQIQKIKNQTSFGVQSIKIGNLSGFDTSLLNTLKDTLPNLKKLGDDTIDLAINRSDDGLSLSFMASSNILESKNKSNFSFLRKHQQMPLRRETTLMPIKVTGEKIISAAKKAILSLNDDKIFEETQTMQNDFW